MLSLPEPQGQSWWHPSPSATGRERECTANGALRDQPSNVHRAAQAAVIPHGERKHKVPEKIDDEQLDDDEAQQLLADADDTDDDGDTDDDANQNQDPKDRDKGDENALRDPGKRALDAMKRERNAARKELNAIKARLREFEDKDKSEAQRLQEARDEAATRAAKAEERHRALTVAMERAPEYATLAQVRAVAKRVRGESEEDLEADADELFEMLAPPPPAKDKDKSEPRDRKAVAGRPRERLRGGGDPEDEPEESDPRKLADLIRRR